MTLPGLALGNLLRNKLRTGLTVVGIAAALFLFCFLEAVLGGFQAGADIANASRLMTRNAVSLVQPLPIAFQSKIRAVKGVKDLSLQVWFGGQWEADTRLFFPQFAVDPESFLRLFTEYLVEPAEKEAFLKDRKGCLLGSTIAERLGKGPGETVVLKGTIYPGTWEFNVAGIFRGKDSAADDLRMLFHYDYLTRGSRRRRRGS
ncbi:MAG: ABC transporter permease [Planctomycetes bacterium]|nr:ABC transporter permease [Planctomycetota bacterium]